MSKNSAKFKRALALLLSFVMVVSVLTVAPATTSEAAAKKIVKKLSVSGKVTLDAGQSKTVNAKVTANKKKVYGKNDLWVTVKTSNKNVATAKVTNPKTSKKKISSATSKIKITAKNVAKKSTAKITVTAKSKSTKGKTVKKTITVTVNPKTQPTTQPTTPTVPTKPTEPTQPSDPATPQTVAVTGVSLEPKELKLAVEGTSKLTATISPANATTKDVTWTSNDSSIATVDANGEVKARGVGVTTVVVTTKDGEYTAECKVIVENSTLGKADSLSITVQNSQEKYSNPEKNEYVRLTGQDASVRIRVTAGTQPIGNQDVKLSIKEQYGNAEGLYRIDGKDTTKVVTTNSDGYATFSLITAGKYEDATATADLYESYLLSANLITDDTVKSSATLAFGSVYLVSPFVLNEEVDDKEIAVSKMVQGQNALESNDGGSATVRSKDGKFSQLYVTSQQQTYPVTLVTYPVLHLPMTENGVKSGKQVDTSFAKRSGEYSVYNDETNEQTTTIIETIPAGLEWGNICFSAMELSEYTKLVVTFYELNNDGNKTLIQVGEPVVRTSENIDTSALTVPVPKRDNGGALYAKIVLYSEGQVNDDKNAGYVVDKIEYEYSGSAKTKARELPIDGTVTWEKDADFKRASSQDYTLTLAEASQYLPGGTKNEHYNENYKYDYVVPAFPSVGSAVINVKNQANEIIARYTYPIKWNENNTNDINKQEGVRKAVYIGEQEYNNQVGNIKSNNYYVTITSDEAGYTPLKAQIDLSGLGIEITNPEVHSYIQWSPYYKEEEKVLSEDFYALKGQKVSITAQLVSTTNENTTVTQSGSDLKFTVADGQDLETFVNDTNFTAKTDGKGQCTFTVSAPEQYDYLKDLAATTEGYKVKLIIGGKTVEQANIHWIDAGLYYRDSAVDGTSFSTYDNLIVSGDESNKGKDGYSSNMDRMVGSNWIFGLKTIGLTDKLTEENKYSVYEISGIGIDFTKSGVGEGAKTEKNGEYKLTSDKTGTTSLVGKIDENSVKESSDVVFTIVDEIGRVVGKYKNVGIGEPRIAAIITLKIGWIPDGLNVVIKTPLGRTLDSKTASTVYVLVTDKFGNEQKECKVIYNVSELGGIKEVKNAEGVTDEHGLLAIQLNAPEEKGIIKINATVQDKSDTCNIEYVSNDAGAFTITEATLDKNTSTVSVKLSNEVSSDTVDVKAFKLEMLDKDGNVTQNYAIDKAVCDDNQAKTIIITLKDGSSLTNVDVSQLRLTISPYEDDNLQYQIKDQYNQILTGDTSVKLK